VVQSPRVTNDTNIWLSALYFSGKPAEIVRLIEEQKITSVTSTFILEELKEKMLIDFNTPSYAANGTIAYISSISEFVPLRGINFGLRDPSDNNILETALTGKCKWLITGDKDLLTMKKYNEIHIVQPAQFLTEYQVK